jgi:hypothetical protein
LRRKLRDLIRLRQRQELAELFGSRFESNRGRISKESPGQKAARRRHSLQGLVTKRTTLYRSYKGKAFTAHLVPAGTITFVGKQFSSPTEAAKAATRRKKGINGWTFWYIQDGDGDWVRLADYRR